MPETALFIIDIQNDLAQDPATEIPAAQRIRDSATTIIKRARSTIHAHVQRGEPSLLVLIFVQHEEAPEEGPLRRGSRPWELVFPPSPSSALERLVAKTTRMRIKSLLTRPFINLRARQYIWVESQAREGAEGDGG